MSSADSSHTLTQKPCALVMAATSSLGVALSHALASEGWELMLAGGDEEALTRQASDLAIRYGVPVEWLVTSFNAEKRDDTLSYEHLAHYCRRCDSVFVMSDDAVVELQGEAESLAQATKRYYTVPATLLAVFSRFMEARGRGNLVLVSSMTDERGSFEASHYHSARKALLHFTEALQEQQATAGKVHTLMVSLGMVDTPLWYGVTLPFRLEKHLMADREKVAADIMKAMKAERRLLHAPFSSRWLRMLRHKMQHPALPWQEKPLPQQMSDAMAAAEHQPWLPGLVPTGTSGGASGTDADLPALDDEVAAIDVAEPHAQPYAGQAPLRKQLEDA